MATRVEVISYGPFAAPVGTVIGKVVVTFAAANPANTVVASLAPGTVSLSEVLNPDTYTVTAQAFDSASPANAVGPAATESFTISTNPTTVTVSIPLSISGTTE